MVPTHIQRPAYASTAAQTETPAAPEPRTPLEQAARLFLQSGGEVIPDDLQCPCSHELMLKPVFLVDSGQTYDESSILSFFALGNNIDPYTREPLSSQRFVRNWNAQRKVDAFKDAVLALDPNATHYFERAPAATPNQRGAQAEDGFDTPSPQLNSPPEANRIGSPPLDLPSPPPAANRLRSPSLLPLLGSPRGSRSPSRSPSIDSPNEATPPPLPTTTPGFRSIIAELSGTPVYEFHALLPLLDAAGMDEQQREAVAECLLCTFVEGRPARRLSALFCDAMKQVWHNNGERLIADVFNFRARTEGYMMPDTGRLLREALEHCVNAQSDKVEDLDLLLERETRFVGGDLQTAMTDIVYPLTVAYSAACNAMRRLTPSF